MAEKFQHFLPIFERVLDGVDSAEVEADWKDEYSRVLGQSHSCLVRSALHQRRCLFGRQALGESSHRVPSNGLTMAQGS